MSENTSNDLGAFLAGFVIGGLVGAATAIILAPQSGQETRAQIAAKSNELIQAGGEQYQHYRDVADTYAHQYADRASELVAQTQEQARIVLDRGKQSDTSGNSETADNTSEAADNGAA
jgi:gas vesicle protein